MLHSICRRALAIPRHNRTLTTSRALSSLRPTFSPQPLRLLPQSIRLPSPPITSSQLSATLQQTRSWGQAHEKDWIRLLGRPKPISRKKYKLKTHQGASDRWRVIANGHFKRAKAGRSHNNLKNRHWKTREGRKRLVAIPQQRNLLKKLIPYFRKRYMRK
ncbi:hypothetical protein HK097_001839 [Rhizophlyctis rosea]|uniref:50S ribosomal protein L35 n=1 Tax=Rhizophlyctis rosea TaxID=64517 RepID=A0AAD5SHF7_9FUNG|nr:hypothetical protein HK097_001839 [Rhizophlyctis rosea]